MKINKRLALLAVVGGLFSVGAQASVIYNWYPTQAGEKVDVIGGQLEISDDAFLAGSFSESVHADVFYDSDYPEFNVFPNSPIIHVDLQGVPGDAAEPLPYLAANPRDGYNGPGFNSDRYWLNAGMGVFGDLLTGSLSLVTNETGFEMSAGPDGFWTITNFNSDRLAGFCNHTSGPSNDCAGAAGLWQVDPRTVPVPEPSSWALFMLSLVGLSLAAGRRRRPRPRARSLV